MPHLMVGHSGENMWEALETVLRAWRLGQRITEGYSARLNDVSQKVKMREEWEPLRASRLTSIPWETDTMDGMLPPICWGFWSACEMGSCGSWKLKVVRKDRMKSSICDYWLYQRGLRDVWGSGPISDWTPWSPRVLILDYLICIWRRTDHHVSVRSLPGCPVEWRMCNCMLVWIELDMPIM